MTLAVSQVSSSSAWLWFHRTESATFSAPVRAQSELNVKKCPEAKPLKAENTKFDAKVGLDFYWTGSLVHIPASAASCQIRPERHTNTCSLLALKLGFWSSEPTSQVDSNFPRRDSIWVLFGQASTKSSLFSPELWQGSKYAKRAKTHMAYPSASSLWMNGINNIIHPSENGSGSIPVSLPLMVPNEGTQARGHKDFRGVSFYQLYHLLNLPSPAATWRKNGSLQIVKFGINLPLNQQANPRKDWILYQKTSAELRNHCWYLLVSAGSLTQQMVTVRSQNNSGFAPFGENPASWGLFFTQPRWQRQGLLGQQRNTDLVNTYTCTYHISIYFFSYFSYGFMKLDGGITVGSAYRLADHSPHELGLSGNLTSFFPLGTRDCCHSGTEMSWGHLFPCKSLWYQSDYGGK